VKERRKGNVGVGGEEGGRKNNRKKGDKGRGHGEVGKK
jgi:hypothetical protein